MNEAAAEPGLSRLLSDERLTRRAVGGDQRAFAAIFRRYHQSLYRFCLAIVGNPEDAQEALQNTMVKVLRALPGEERRIELKPWLYRIAHNESIDLLRRRRESRELDVEQIAPGYGLAEDAATRERLRQLIADLRELPERQREVLVMRELAGLGFEEIAAALDSSGAVARQTLYEARQSLRQMEEGREMSCATVRKALSDGDGRIARRRDIRAHLRTCAGCHAFREEIRSRQRDLAALSPLPAVAAAGMLQGLIGGSHGAAGGGLAATLGGGAAKTIGTSAAAKGLATAAVVAAVGVTAADRAGVIHLDLPGGRDAQPARQAAPAPGGGGGTAAQAARGQGAAGAGRAGSSPGASAAGAPPAGLEPHGAAASGHSRRGGRGAASEKAHGWGPGVEHPSGAGHEKQHPPAASTGQETAAAHQPPPEPAAGGKGGGREEAPPKPSQAAPPQAPAAPPAEPPGAAPAPAEPEVAPSGPPGEHGASGVVPGSSATPEQGP